MKCLFHRTFFTPVAKSFGTDSEQRHLGPEFESPLMGGTADIVGVVFYSMIVCIQQTVGTL